MLFATAKERGCSPAQIALAWVLHQPHVTSVLISVNSVTQLRELVAAARLKLSREELERLSSIRSHERVAAATV